MSENFLLKMQNLGVKTKKNLGAKFMAKITLQISVGILSEFEVCVLIATFCPAHFFNLQRRCLNQPRYDGY